LKSKINFTLYEVSYVDAEVESILSPILFPRLGFGP